METGKLPLLLITDDSQMNRLLLADMLCDSFEILEAASGPECLQVLRERGEQISLILLDVVMPGMSGIDVLRLLHLEGWTKRIPVIIVSEHIIIGDEENLYDLGAAAFISRPVSEQVVRQKVFAALQQPV